MSKFELVFDITLALIVYGLIGLVAGFVGFLMWTDFEFETLLKVTAGLGIILGIVGASIPFTRKAAVFVFSFFTPSSW
ncbi:MAG: hypothetical protein AAFO74_00755 [Pseudomonadota bacterium]